MVNLIIKLIYKLQGLEYLTPYVMNKKSNPTQTLYVIRGIR